MKRFKINHKILDLLISPVEYAQHKRKSSYILNVKKNGQEILLYGCNHSSNWRNPHFAEIKKLFIAYRNRCKQKQTIAVIENFIPDKITDLKQMIQLFNESGYVYWLAHQAKIKLICIEPTKKQLFDFIHTKGHKKENIALWLFLNFLKNNIDKKKSTLKCDIKKIRQLFRAISKDTKIDIKYSLLAKQFNGIVNKKILPIKMTELKKYKIQIQVIKKIENPFSNNTVINKIGSDLNLARDYFMAEKIVSLFKKGYSVFGALGINHVISQEAVYKKILNKKGM